MKLRTYKLTIYPILCLLSSFVIINTPSCKEAENTQPILENDIQYNVREFGATGDGVTLDHEFINEAIDSCSQSGGGTVYFPPGTYLSGSIHLQSNIEMYLDSGATILGASNHINAYDPAEPNEWDDYQDFGHSHFQNALIWGENITNITIRGDGTINGGGMTRSNNVPKGGGDKAISLKLCRDILIEDITIEQGGHFAFLANGCDNIIIKDIRNS